MVMCLDSSRPGSVSVTAGAAELFRYVYEPTDAQLESPRPYFHPVRTLRGDVVTLYRPHDHVWHKGIAWSLPNAGPANFWGGTTYLRGQGYRQLANNGRMRHEAFRQAGVTGEVAHLDEELTWVTEQGQDWFAERRRIAAALLPRPGTWLLAFETTIRNVSGATIAIGSPTTEGRDNAGYGGLFWRGPRSFTGGRVLTPEGPGGDERMGMRAPWLGLTGRHDGPPAPGAPVRASTVLMRDRPGNLGYPCQWFARSTPFACLCPAPFFSEEHPLPDGGSLTLSYAIAVADGELTAAECGELAALMDHAVAALPEPAAHAGSTP